MVHKRNDDDRAADIVDVQVRCQFNKRKRPLIFIAVVRTCQKCTRTVAVFYLRDRDLNGPPRAVIAAVRQAQIAVLHTATFKVDCYRYWIIAHRLFLYHKRTGRCAQTFSARRRDDNWFSNF